MRKFITKFILFSLFMVTQSLFISCVTGKNENELKYAKNPYLKQHQDNPVWWKEWSTKTFQKAKRENKIIFLSIGYSSCHWCHVMEKESFESEEVAKILNKHFVAIKVDREERPDVDKIYMNAVQAMNKRGGWPLSVFLTPDLNPFWGGTYFPKEQFIQILQHMVKSWKEKREEIQKNGKNVKAYLDQLAKNRGPIINIKKAMGMVVPQFLSQLQTIFDANNGGFGKGNGPKFPPVTKLRAIIRVTKDPYMLKMVDKTLLNMYMGGIYDHIGGGFHRYSTDRIWLVPHFEKMLYDNALLAIIYTEAYQLSHHELYRFIAQDILSYIGSQMTASDGGFYSSEDADSDGEEGLFYLWKKNDVDPSFPYNLNQGIFNLLTFNGTAKELQNIWTEKNKKIKANLYQQRAKRVRPFKDKKILSGWNGLMIQAYAKAYQAFQNKDYLGKAQKAAHFIKENLDIKGTLYRSSFMGNVSSKATLDDYAYLIAGLLDLYEADFDDKWIIWAKDLQSRQNQNLWSTDNKAYFFALKSPNLIAPSIEFHDNARPNSNCYSLLNLLRLYSLTYDESYSSFINDLFSSFSSQMVSHPTSMAMAILALSYQKKPSQEIAIIGPANHPEVQKMIDELQTGFYPAKMMTHQKAKATPAKELIIPLLQGKGMLQNKPTVYICQNKICLKPLHTFKEFKKEIR